MKLDMFSLAALLVQVTAGADEAVELGARRKDLSRRLLAAAEALGGGAVGNAALSKATSGYMGSANPRVRAAAERLLEGGAPLAAPPSSTEAPMISAFSDHR